MTVSVETILRPRKKAVTVCGCDYSLELEFLEVGGKLFP